jgi:DNA-binding Xre family transcriptional regulator
MARKLGYRWHLREVMGARGLWQTTDLAPLLEERGIVLSAPQVYRLVVQTPERLSLRTLMALCDALDCAMTDLIEPVEERAAAKRKRKTVGGDTDAVLPRPKRARVSG